MFFFRPVVLIMLFVAVDKETERRLTSSSIRWSNFGETNSEPATGTASLSGNTITEQERLLNHEPILNLLWRWGRRVVVQVRRVESAGGERAEKFSRNNKG